MQGPCVKRELGDFVISGAVIFPVRRGMMA